MGWRPIVLAGLLCAVTGDGAGADSATLEARYAATLTGVQIGQGAIVAEIDPAGYSVSGSALVAGILQLVAPGKGSAAARGSFLGGRLAPTSYTGSSEIRERSREVRLAGAAGTIREISIIPERRAGGDRVPVTEEHRTGVVDPLSAVLMPVAGDGDLAGPAACDRTLPIFDGQERYDLVFSFVRTETVKDVRGYSGPLAVCQVTYRPIAGHRKNRRPVQELSENREIFVWLAPIAGTRVLAPLRVSFGSKIGTFVVQATLFRSVAKPPAGAPATR